jgi:hypothetical protein
MVTSAVQIITQILIELARFTVALDCAAEFHAALVFLLTAGFHSAFG